MKMSRWEDDLYDGAVNDIMKRLIKLYAHSALRIKRNIEDLYNKIGIFPFIGNLLTTNTTNYSLSSIKNLTLLEQKR